MLEASVLGSGGSNGSIASSASICELLLLFSWLQNLEAAHECIVNRHHGSSVVELSAVVRSTEESDQLSLGEELVAVLHNLVSSADQIDVMFLGEGGNNFLAKSEADSSIILAPALHVLVGVTPEQVAEETGVGNVGWSHDSLDLVERGQFWGETSVHAEYLFVNNGRNGETVETVGEGLPELNVVSALALVVESVDSVDGSALVVASQQEEVLGILNFVGEEKTHSLQTLLASVNVVSQEEVIGIRREPTVLK